MTEVEETIGFESDQPDLEKVLEEKEQEILRLEKKLRSRKFKSNEREDSLSRMDTSIQTIDSHESTIDEAGSEASSTSRESSILRKGIVPFFPSSQSYSAIHPPLRQKHYKYIYISCLTYSALLRWLVRNNFLEKLTLYPFLAPWVQAKPDERTVFYRMVQHLGYSLRAVSIPQSSSMRIRPIFYISKFWEGVRWTTHTFWPAAFTGLLTHDIAEFYLHPENRYGTTISQIFLGTADNQMLLASQLGSDLAGEFSYYLGITLIIGTALMTGLLMNLSYRFLAGVRYTEEHSEVSRKTAPLNYLKQQLAKDQLGFYFFQTAFEILWNKELGTQERNALIDSLVYASQEQQIFRPLYAIHALTHIVDSFSLENVRLFMKRGNHSHWIQLRHKAHRALSRASYFDGITPHQFLRYLYVNYQLWTLGKANNILLSPLFCAAWFYLFYTNVRLWELFISKIIGGIDYYQSMQACEAEGKSWGYIREFGDYYCAVCGDWPFVYVNDRFSAQGCLDWLLGVPQEPEMLLSHLPRLTSHELQTFNFAPQFNKTWSSLQWHKLMQILQKVRSLGTLNLSYPSPTNLSQPPFFNVTLIGDLSTFLQGVSLASLDISYQRLSDELMADLLQSLHPSTSLIKLDLSGNCLMLTNNSLTVFGKVFKSQRSLQTLKMGVNEVNGTTVIDLVGELVKTNATITNFDISGNSLGDSGIEGLVSQLPDISIIALNVSATNFTESGFQAITGLLSNSLVMSLDISSNDLSEVSQGNWTYFWNVTTRSSLRNFTAQAVKINDAQLNCSQPYLPQTKIAYMDLSNNAGKNLTYYSLAPFICGLQNTTVINLNLASNNLTDAGMRTASECTLSNLSWLNLSNNSLSSESILGSQSFLNIILFNQQGNVINDNKNQLHIDLSLNNFVNDILYKFAFLSPSKSVTQLIPLVELILSDNRIDSDRGFKFFINNRFTNNIVTLNGSLTTLDFSGNPISNHRGIEVIAEKLPESPLQSLNLENTSMADSDLQALAQSLVTPKPPIVLLQKTSLSLDARRAFHRQTKPNTQLNIFKIGRNFNLTTLGKHALCRVLPNTDISAAYIIDRPYSFASECNELSASVSHSSFGIYFQLVHASYALSEHFTHKRLKEFIADSDSEEAVDDIDKLLEVLNEEDRAEASTLFTKNSTFFSPVPISSSFVPSRVFPTSSVPRLSHSNEEKFNDDFSPSSQSSVLTALTISGTTTLFILGLIILYLIYRTCAREVRQLTSNNVGFFSHRPNIFPDSNNSQNETLSRASCYENNQNSSM